MPTTPSDRLERAIAHQGLASRREAKALITSGAVTVNGKVITEPGFPIIIDKDVIAIKGNTRANKESVLVYKPRGIETNKTLAQPASGKPMTREPKDLHDYFPQFKHLSPIGRLDKESEGLIIMSNDGLLTRALTQENSKVGKTYLVKVRENVTDNMLDRMRTGIILSEKSASGKSTADKVKTKPAEVKRKTRTSFTIVLHEGRKHQIRRMCDACRLTVTDLIRIKIGDIASTGMKAGNARRLTETEVRKFL